MKNSMKASAMIALMFILAGCENEQAPFDKDDIERMVYQHAKAWETGDKELLETLLHEDVVFAYPGRRLNKTQTLDDLDYFAENFNETRVYTNKIIIANADVAVEWQFATTSKGSGKRQVVNDAIIARIEDGKFIVWKEYLDGRVKLLQETGELYLEEGEEPYPWPLKTESYGRKHSTK